MSLTFVQNDLLIQNPAVERKREWPEINRFQHDIDCLKTGL